MEIRLLRQRYRKLGFKQISVNFYVETAALQLCQTFRDGKTEAAAFAGAVVVSAGETGQ